MTLKLMGTLFFMRDEGSDGRRGVWVAGDGGGDAEAEGLEEEEGGPLVRLRERGRVQVQRVRHEPKRPQQPLLGRLPVEGRGHQRAGTAPGLVLSSSLPLSPAAHCFSSYFNPVRPFCHHYLSYRRRLQALWQPPLCKVPCQPGEQLRPFSAIPSRHHRLQLPSCFLASCFFCIRFSFSSIDESKSQAIVFGLQHDSGPLAVFPQALEQPLQPRLCLFQRIGVLKRQHRQCMFSIIIIVFSFSIVMWLKMIGLKIGLS